MSELLDKVKEKKATICILGLGRVGLPLASVFASKGIDVIGIDINEERLASIRSGKCPFYDPALAENMDISYSSGKLTVESDLDKINQDWFERLAELLTNMDGMLIRIEGFADARGNVEYNAQLSADRALAVQDALIRAGVPSGRIVLDFYGEQFSRADESDLDGLAMERRVELSLVNSSKLQQVAQK